MIKSYWPGGSEPFRHCSTGQNHCAEVLVYATGTGFGISGPDRNNLAMDLTIQAASGIMSVTGAPDGPPMKAGPTLVDFMGGIHLYAAILTALYDRDSGLPRGSGEGRLVEVAMQEAVYPSLAASFE